MGAYAIWLFSYSLEVAKSTHLSIIWGLVMSGRGNWQSTGREWQLQFCVKPASGLHWIHVTAELGQDVWGCYENLSQPLYAFNLKCLQRHRCYSFLCFYSVTTLNHSRYESGHLTVISNMFVVLNSIWSVKFPYSTVLNCLVIVLNTLV